MIDRRCVLFLASILAGCSTRLVESDEVLVDTRGVPIVQVVIEGPGGDLVPVEHRRINDETAFVFEGNRILRIAGIAAIGTILVFLVPRWRRERFSEMKNKG